MSAKAESVPVVVARRAELKDLRVLNRKFNSGKKEKLTAADLLTLIVLEINGKIRGFTKSGEADFLEVSGHPIVKEVGSIVAKAEFERKNSDLEFKALVRKHGVEKLAQMYEERLKELLQESKRQ